MPPPSQWEAWTACRTSSLANAHASAHALSSPSWTPAVGDVCLVDAPVPGTILGALLANGTFRYADGGAVVDPFLDDTLATEGVAHVSVPDVSSLGVDFFSYTFRATVDSANVPGCAAGGPFARSARVVLSLAQSSYRVAAYLGGGATPLSPVDARPGETDAVGMFRRFDFLVPAPDVAAFCAVMVHGFAFDVRPPDHPGNASHTCKGCGQGGNHAIAQDLVSQDTCGWDWVGGTADRNTGLIDPVEVFVAEAGVLLRGAAVSCSRVDVSASDPSRADRVDFVFRVSLFNLDTASASVGGSLLFEIVELGVSVEVTDVSLPASAPPDNAWADFTSPVVTVRNASLWYPNGAGVGSPFLYAATARFSQPDPVVGRASASISWRAGLRTVTSAVDVAIGGQVFSVNGRRLYLTGGNWIATDQLSRSEFRGPERYGAEVALHAAMGMNVMRLWGGHGGHARHLWDAADEQGMFLFHEWWMSGDNNGRWAQVHITNQPHSPPADL